VQRGHLILGTELTKHAHDSFTATQIFTDQLTGYDYLGEGKYGLEFELRGDHVARRAFPSYFKGSATIDELADGRIHDIQATTSRLALQRPEKAEGLLKTQASRIERTNAERLTLNLIHDHADPKIISEAVSKLPQASSEIANIDGFDLTMYVSPHPVPDWKCAPGEFLTTLKSELGTKTLEDPQ
jgi:hypothetical protein